MRRALRTTVAAIVLVVNMVVVYGFAIEPRLMLDEERHQTVIPGLSAEADGTEVAVIADLQIGMWFANIGMVERIVERVVDEEPAALLIAGDFLYSEDPPNREKIETVLDLLEPVRNADIPTFAVLGNHDYLVDAADQLTESLVAHDVTVLQNASSTLSVPGANGADAAVQIVGIGPAYQGLADVDKALSEVPDDAPRLVMMHNPTTFPALPPGSAPLAVAGHTHCGQIAVPGTPQWSWLAWTTNETMVADGFAPDGFGATGNALFVSCGIGFSNLPMRISAPPQLVFFELHSTPDS